MAQKQASLKLSPLMSLSILAIFLIMVPLFSVANQRRQVARSQAAQPRVTATPAPTQAPTNLYRR